MLRFAFYPRPLGGRRYQGISQKSNRVSDFYPRPPGGGRRARAAHRACRQYRFLSTPSGWRATGIWYVTGHTDKISIHALRVEGDQSRPAAIRRSPISIHALRVEGDSCVRARVCASDNFYPRPPGGGRPQRRAEEQERVPFLSTPSGWRATFFRALCFADHADFYPRPPGGGRPIISFTIPKRVNFYPRPPGGGRRSSTRCRTTATAISIHALRVEGDAHTLGENLLVWISIHALRVEGDQRQYRLPSGRKHFYPRPPGGGRPCF